MKYLSIGDRVERLVVVQHEDYPWCRCICDCGTVVRVSIHELTRPDRPTRSCGCLQRQRAAETQYVHGLKGTPTMSSWASMMRRCYEPQHRSFAEYGRLGIRVHEPWHDIRNFVADVGLRPSVGHSIDRFPNRTGHYEPGNVRWATATEQARNTSRNLRFMWLGEERSLAEIVDLTGMKYGTLRRRVVVAGWDIQRAVSTPVQKWGR